MGAAALLLAAAAAALPGAGPAAGQGGGTPTPVLVRTVERGQILSATDFDIERLPVAVARGALTPAEAAGQEATRRLVAGVPVRSGDVAAARLVHRGETVTIALVSGALRITSPGRALSDAGLGEPVRVLNLATSRTLDGVATASGEVRISAQ